MNEALFEKRPTDKKLMMPCYCLACEVGFMVSKGLSSNLVIEPLRECVRLVSEFPVLETRKLRLSWVKDLPYVSG